MTRYLIGLDAAAIDSPEQVETMRRRLAAEGVDAVFIAGATCIVPIPDEHDEDTDD